MIDVEVTSQGETMDEALENLMEVLELYFDDVAPIDPFNSPIIAPLDVEWKPCKDADDFQSLLSHLLKL